MQSHDTTSTRFPGVPVDKWNLGKLEVDFDKQLSAYLQDSILIIISEKLNPASSCEIGPHP